jgi:hypothetical protein
MAPPITNVSSPANGTAADFTLLTTICSAGWVVKSYGDGLAVYNGAYNLASNPFGTSGSGAGNLGNSNAWWRAAAPDGSRECLSQRSTTDQTWTKNRSKAGFVGGSPNASTAPTATDATALYTAATVYSAPPGRWFISVDDADDYGWTAFALVPGGGNILTFFADEPLQTGTAPPEDTDPYMWAGYYNSSGLAANGQFVVNPSGSIQVYKRFTAPGSNHRVTYGVVYDPSTGATLVPASGTGQGQLGPTPVGVKEVPWQIPVSRPINGTYGTSTGWIGVPSRQRYCTVGGRVNGDKLVSGSDNWIYVAGLWVKWDSSTPLLS